MPGTQASGSKPKRQYKWSYKVFPASGCFQVCAPTQATIMKIYRANVERFKLNLLLRVGG